MKLSRQLLHKVKNIPIQYKPDVGYTKEIRNIINETLNYKLIRIPSVINGQKYYDNLTKEQISPININKKVCAYNDTHQTHLVKYLNEFKDYKKSLISFSQKDRINVFNKAADLLCNKYREQMLAYTILGQGKSLYEAEIDAICELGDFLNFNVEYYNTILQKQPISIEGISNHSLYNPLNGFVAAITPFNFTAIGGNLASAPTLFGNSVIWKPSDSSILSNYLFYQILEEAGMPHEAIAFTPSCPKRFSNIILSDENLGGLLFTGSSDVFSNLYREIGINIDKYNNYPRLVGETGGKNFHFIHYDLDQKSLQISAKKTIESAYGYSGQKCSACSIVYVPKSKYDEFIDYFKLYRDDFMSNESHKNYGVINLKSYMKSKIILEELKSSEQYEIVCGGTYSNQNGSYYIEPTLVKCINHNDIIFRREFFSPILAVYPYEEEELEYTLNLCKNSSKYGLTGSVFSQNESFIEFSKSFFQEKCGNFYINDKSTGSVVGQQPFGGSGRSGTNDKAGDINLLYRLFNQQNIKRNNDFKFSI